MAKRYDLGRDSLEVPAGWPLAKAMRIFSPMKQTIAKRVLVMIGFAAVNIIARQFLTEKQAGMVTAMMIYMLWALRARSSETDPGRRRQILIGGIIVTSSPLIPVAGSFLAGDNVDLQLAAWALMLIMAVIGFFLSSAAIRTKKQVEGKEYEKPPHLSGGKRKRSKKKRRFLLFTEDRGRKV